MDIPAIHTQWKELMGVTKAEWEECQLAEIIHLQKKRIQNEPHVSEKLDLSDQNLTAPDDLARPGQVPQ
jgi:hypothetical protein